MFYIANPFLPRKVKLKSEICWLAYWFLKLHDNSNAQNIFRESGNQVGNLYAWKASSTTRWDFSEKHFTWPISLIPFNAPRSRREWIFMAVLLWIHGIRIGRPTSHISLFKSFNTPSSIKKKSHKNIACLMWIISWFKGVTGTSRRLRTWKVLWFKLRSASFLLKFFSYFSLPCSY